MTASVSASIPASLVCRIVAQPVAGSERTRRGGADLRRGSSAQTRTLSGRARKRTEDDYPVHSFTSLLTDLATICANHIQPTNDLPAFTKTTTPTPLQRRAFDLLAVSHRHGLA
jgi:hypothetical protein